MLLWLEESYCCQVQPSRLYLGLQILYFFLPTLSIHQTLTLINFLSEATRQQQVNRSMVVTDDWIGWITFTIINNNLCLYV